MDHFNFHNDQLFAEEVPVATIVQQYGTPCYIYSRATLERHWKVFNEAFGAHPHRICYAVKANSNIAILNLLAKLGCGFDIVSQGELERVLVAGGNPKNILFSGVGKLVPEIKRGLEVGIACFNVESTAELLRLNDIAGQQGKKAPISLRVNPDIDANTHPYISTGLKENKFGVDIDEAISLYELARSLPHLEIRGVGYHIGSQLTELKPFLEAFDRVYDLVKKLRQHGVTVHHLDIGGGLGVRYSNEVPPSPAEYITEIISRLGNDSLEIIVEPGRAIAANAGILVTRIEYLKMTPHKNFAIVDAAMNDLLRPALYNAYQEIIAVENQDRETIKVDVVGPVCETGDFLGKDRMLAVKDQDLLAIRTAGAYGFTMSSNYNSRPRIPEIMVDGDKIYLIRARETIQDLFMHEKLLPEEATCL
ncbi:MAG: diaminopimelate decarboxylase [Gammaproteobacteria bacterium]|nr:diaminopimelate decarboxylase [Gammaproteobacteria bacterium]